MIVIMEPGATPEQIAGVVTRIKGLGSRRAPLPR